MCIFQTKPVVSGILKYVAYILTYHIYHHITNNIRVNSNQISTVRLEIS